MGPKQGAMVCCQDSVEIKDETQSLEGRCVEVNLPFLIDRDNGFPGIQTLSDLLGETAKIACREREYSKALGEKEGWVNSGTLTKEGELETSVISDKRRSTLKDLLERSVQEEVGGVQGLQVVEKQEDKSHPPLEQKEEEEVINRRPGPGLTVEVPQDHVVVAVNKDQGSKDALMWALRNLVPPASAITLLHVRPLNRSIPAPRQGSRDATTAQDRDARRRATEIVREHQQICNGDKVDSEIVIVEGDPVGKTLVDQIIRFQITKLVLGTSSRNLLTRKLKGPQIPAYVAKHSPPFCSVMVVSKNKLISVKEAQYSPLKISSPRKTSSEKLPRKSSTDRQLFEPKPDELAYEMSLTDMVTSQTQNFAVGFETRLNYGVGQGSTSLPLPKTSLQSGKHGRSSSVPMLGPLSLADTRCVLGERDELDEDCSFSFAGSPDGKHNKDLKPLISNSLSCDIFKNLPQEPRCSVSEPSSPSYSSQEATPNAWTIILPKKSKTEASSSFGLDEPKAAVLEEPVPLVEYKSFPSSPRGENLFSDGMKVIEIDKHASFELSTRVREESSVMGFKFEQEPSAVEPMSSLTGQESLLLLDEVKVLKTKLEEAQMAVEVARKDAEINARRVQEAEEAAAKAVRKAEEFAARQEEEAKMKEEALKLAKIAELHATEEARKCYEALELAKVAQQALKEEMQLRKSAEEKAKQEQEARQAFWAALQKSQSPYREYNYEELRAASDNFGEHRKLGEGGYGVVYQGTLHHTTVAIKVLNPDGVQGPKEFQREVELLGRIHHPHMVMLLGCCPQKGCLVYEYMANGSLEDRLLCKGNTPPLPWTVRFRVAAEVATALLFLHSSKPEPIVHRDLKPANVLLDKNFVSKIGDVGLARLVPERYPGYTGFNSTYYRDTVPVGTFAYIDPEYQRTGSFGPKSDVYALGIVILQLLTSTPAVGVFEVVEEALENGTLEEILDCSAGEWPFEETRELASLALECAEMRRRNRPDLETRVLPILDKLRNLVDVCLKDSHSGPVTKGGSLVPAVFLCPIYQELMEDPVIAADGHTYEYEAIHQWLEEHGTSPMTNLQLAHRNLTPNFDLRAAICDWEAKLRENQLQFSQQRKPSL